MMLFPAAPAVFAVILTMEAPPVAAVMAVAPTFALNAAIMFVAICALDSAVAEVELVTAKYSTLATEQNPFAPVPFPPHCSVVPPLSVAPDHAKLLAVPFESAIVSLPAPIVVAVRFTTPDPPVAAATPTLLPFPVLLIVAIRFVASVAAVPVTTNPFAGTKVIPPVLGVRVMAPEVVLKASLAVVFVFVTVVVFVAVAADALAFALPLKRQPAAAG